jgi:hypothetical protein
MGSCHRIDSPRFLLSKSCSLEMEKYEDRRVHSGSHYSFGFSPAPVERQKKLYPQRFFSLAAALNCYHPSEHVTVGARHKLNTSPAPKCRNWRIKRGDFLGRLARIVLTMAGLRAASCARSTTPRLKGDYPEH